MYTLTNLRNSNLNGKTVQIVERKDERVLVQIIGREEIFAVSWDCLRDWKGPSVEVAARAAKNLGFKVIQ